MDNATQPTTPPPVSAAPEADLTGQALGDFHILRRLGQGGMGQVYLAEQISLKRKVALKIMRPDLAADASSLKRFQNEAEAVARITHGNIVQVYAIGESTGLHYMALEYVDGRNLRDFLAKKGPPELPLALSIMRQVAAALQRASEHGIVHRDIKPENILLTRKGEVKVADFGLSRCLAADHKPLNLTQSGVTMGTPLYMSPEQVQGQPVDPRSDLYSFGVTCYHMLTGQPPFRGQTAFEVAIQHVQKEAAPLGQLRPDLPPELAAIVHKMMAKEPEKRYQTARELLVDLIRLRDTLPAEVIGAPPTASGALDPISSSMLPAFSNPSGVPMAPPVLPPTIQLRRFIRRRWRTGAALILVLIGLLAGLAWGLYQQFGAVFPNRNVAQNTEPAAPPNPDQIREKQLLERVQTDYNPNDPEQVKRALSHHIDLGLFYLSREPRRLAEADEFYQGLIAEPPHDREVFRTLGHIGHALVLAFQDKPKESMDELLKVRTGKTKPGDETILLLQHPELRAMMAIALDCNLRNIPGRRLPQALEALRDIPGKRPVKIEKPTPAKPTDKPMEKDKGSP